MAEQFDPELTASENGTGFVGTRPVEDPLRQKRTRMRRGLAVALVGLFGLIAMTAMGPMRESLIHLQNSDAELPWLATTAIKLSGSFQQNWWMFAMGFGAAIVVGMLGTLDKYIRGVLILVVLLIIGLGVAAWSVYKLPERIQKEAGELKEKGVQDLKQKLQDSAPK